VSARPARGYTPAVRLGKAAGSHDPVAGGEDVAVQPVWPLVKPRAVTLEHGRSSAYVASAYLAPTTYQFA